MIDVCGIGRETGARENGGENGDDLSRLWRDGNRRRGENQVVVRIVNDGSGGGENCDG